MKKLVIPGAIIVFVMIIATGLFATSKETVVEHVSMYYSSNSDFFADSLKPFAGIKPLSPAPRIFITNQHVLGASLIAKQFTLAADPSVKRVFFITQNNWEAGEASIITSLARWKTPLGSVEPDLGATHALIDAKIAVQDETIFDREHGITGIIPYVAYAFPNARIIPLVIRDRTPDAEVDALARKILGLKDGNTVVVGTIDLSHYLPKPMADAHDRRTLEALESADYDILSRLDIDTAPTMRAVLKVAEGAGEQAFIKTGSANSADITNDPALTSTTGYLIGYFKKGPPKAGQSVSVLFGGDVMLDRNVALQAKKVGGEGLLAGIERLFLGANINLFNLEGTVTQNESIAQRNNKILRFTFEPALTEQVLRAARADVVSLANNHALDFGEFGYEETVERLQALGIHTFGQPFNDRGKLSTEITVKNKNLCFIGFHALFNPDTSSVVSEIKTLRPDCWRLVVFPHWGEEYRDSATPAQQEAAHAFIDAGADAVIGAHPHVVEPVEIYKGKAIFYSLGNFVFDQDFSWETMHGLVVQVDFSDVSTTFTFMPTAVAEGVVTPASYTDAQRVLKRLVDSNLAPNLAHDILTASSFIVTN